jgi:hypothetical protein
MKRRTMELNDLIFLGACSLRAAWYGSEGQRAEETKQAAVREAKAIWEEVLKQHRERNNN